MPHATARQCNERGTLIACGPGVERVAEEFAQFFPNARYAIASSDTLHGPAETQAAIRAMAKREIDVLIGTQIVAKGHHFPQLTLVGVIDADLGGARRRSARARAHLPIAASGVGPRRPRRKAGPGAAADPQSRRCGDAGAGAAATATASTSRSATFAKRAGAPPFGRLAALVISGYDGDAVREIARAAGQGRASRART